MSHWSKGKVKIKDLAAMDAVAKKAGLSVSRAKSMQSNYAGSIDCERVYWKDGGSAAVVKNSDGTYQLTMDNWNNPIARKIGNNGDVLMRDYAVEMVHSQAMQMGGVISNETFMSDGSVEVEIQI